MEVILNHHYAPLRMTNEDWRNFLARTNCEMCSVEFTKETQKHRDHEHLCPLDSLSTYRAALCRACNLCRAGEKLNDIGVVAHFGSRFDTKLLIRPMADRVRVGPNRRFKVVQKNRETNMVIFFQNYMFLDSFNFMDSSLAKLIEVNVKDEKTTAEPVFPILMNFVGGSVEKYQILCRKLPFPYKYLTSFDVLPVEQLPSRSEFTDDLKKEEISDSDYTLAQTVWDMFECKNFQNFLELYLSCDVILLSAIFTRYCDICARELGCDPCHFFSSSHLSWQCALKYTKVEIQLIDDMEIYNFIRKHIKGGLCFIATRYARANLPHLPDFDETQPRTELRYLDARGLYSWALRKPLPIGNFEWLDEEELLTFDVEKACAEQGKGYILECDVEVPYELRDWLKDYPPLAQKIIPDPALWTRYQRKLAEITGQLGSAGKTPKLIADLTQKQNYVLHGSLLLVCLKIGLKLRKIHRILKFDEVAWAKSYIDLLESKRQAAKTLFESNQMKKMMNSIYGYLLSDVSKRLKTSMVTSEKTFVRCSNKPNFRRWDIYGKRLVSVELQPQSVLLSSPISAGMVCLDRSKLHMLSFFYFFIKKHYGNRVTLLMTDTDSFIIKIENSESLNDIMLKNQKYFDLSEMPGKYNSMVNQKRAGCFKDELGGQQEILEFCGVRSKCYSLRLLSEREDSKCKGLPKVAMKDIKFNDYMEALRFPIPDARNKSEFLSIRSVKQVICTISERKTRISGFDDKRVILPNGVDTVPYNYLTARELDELDSLKNR